MHAHSQSHSHLSCRIHLKGLNYLDRISLSSAPFRAKGNTIIFGIFICIFHQYSFGLHLIRYVRIGPNRTRLFSPLSVYVKIPRTGLLCERQRNSKKSTSFFKCIRILWKQLEHFECIHLVFIKIHQKSKSVVGFVFRNVSDRFLIFFLLISFAHFKWFHLIVFQLPARHKRFSFSMASWCVFRYSVFDCCCCGCRTTNWLIRR